jgi:transcriptional regulator of NAD metabolism
MTAEERRSQILAQLSDAPVSATVLAKNFGVSRQVVVGDIALLRAAGCDITATPRGYIIPSNSGLIRRLACVHSAQQTREELYLMVDFLQQYEKAFFRRFSLLTEVSYSFSFFAVFMAAIFSLVV